MGKSRKSWKNLKSVDGEAIKTATEFSHLEDSDLFVIDDTPAPVKLSKREERLKAHRERLAKLNDDKKDVDIKKPIRPISKREKIVLKNKYVRGKEPTPPIRELPKSTKAEKDLWENEPEEMDTDAFVRDAKDYEFKQRKISRAKKPKKTAEYIPSGRKAVIVPKPGASYNPETKYYIDYAKEIATEELEKQEEEKRIKKGLSLPEGVSYVTAEEKQAELEQGFFEESSSDDEDDKDQINDEEKPEKLKNKPKTIKQKKRALAHKLAMAEKKLQKEMTKKLNYQFTNIRKIIKEINEDISAIEVRSKERKAERMIDNLMKKKKLGRGEFKKYEEPVLLPNEIKGSLRLAKTEGSLLEERFKSLQERNMLPQAGPDDGRRLPKRLRRRYVEKRGTEEITATSRVI